MSKAGLFGQSRSANIAFLMFWISLLSIDVYFIATHLHTMGLSKKIAAGGLLFSALIWIRLAVDVLRAEES